MEISQSNICIRPFNKLAITLALLIVALIGSNFIIVKRDSFTEYLLVAGYSIAMFYWAASIHRQKIIFSDTSVSFIKMSVESDFTLPRTLRLTYDEINSVRLLGDHLFIHATRGKVSFPLKPDSKTATALKSAFEAHDIPFEINSSVVTKRQHE